MIKAIQTRYKGYHFRSRLEARWAVFFDALGIAWEYEPEGFELPDGARYLPDFFLRIAPEAAARQKYPNAGYWVEIKGDRPTPAECRALSDVCVGTNTNGVLLWGAVGENYPMPFRRTGDDNLDFESKEMERLEIEHILSQTMRDCMGREFEGFTPLEGLAYSAIVSCCSEGEIRLAPAIAAARSARFEYGQSGATA